MKRRRKKQNIQKSHICKIFGLIVAITVIAVSGGVLIKKDDNRITRRHTYGIYEPY